MCPQNRQKYVQEISKPNTTQKYRYQVQKEQIKDNVTEIHRDSTQNLLIISTVSLSIKDLKLQPKARVAV